MEGHRTLPVKIILTEKGGEFVKHDIDAWYNARGIQHVQVGPKSSHMNPVERKHQSLSDMTKTMLRDSGFSPQLWPDAFEYAVCKSGEQIASKESETRKRQRHSDVPSNGDVSSHMNEDNAAMCRRRASLREAAKRHKPNSAIIAISL
ncbi:unnamed protein product [Peronospora effusa]|uniref:Integrase catalytic domain-containing protein n=1 Tax=Peronospora effusa TaxID=542832 RepID=A0A3R7XVZ3_9STRA|nr:hypothetical protein DD237_005835 [Peronospora effusa]CAI5700995.1 unnamed protein product [Peronospora effusa]